MSATTNATQRAIAALRQLTETGDKVTDALLPLEIHVNGKPAISGLNIAVGDARRALAALDAAPPEPAPIRPASAALRDQIMIAALPVLLAEALRCQRDEGGTDMSPAGVAAWAYEIADAGVVERAK
jgi:hypothetical protein